MPKLIKASEAREMLEQRVLDDLKLNERITARIQDGHNHLSVAKSELPGGDMDLFIEQMECAGYRLDFTKEDVLIVCWGRVENQF